MAIKYTFCSWPNKSQNSFLENINVFKDLYCGIYFFHSIIVERKNVFLKQSCLVLITGILLISVVLQDLMNSGIILWNLSRDSDFKILLKERSFLHHRHCQRVKLILGAVFFQRNHSQYQLWLMLRYIEFIQCFFGEGFRKHDHV